MNPPPRNPDHRYSTRPFPAYAYVPGQKPHPIRDPEGHSYNQHFEDPEVFNAREWQQCDAYLYGIDLFNYGFWWEAHESLEAVWHTAGRTTETGQFIQGLIQISVAHLKKHQGFTDVARRMSTEGLAKMKQIKGIYLGIDVSTFRNGVIDYFNDKTQTPVTIKLIGMGQTQ